MSERFVAVSTVTWSKILLSYREWAKSRYMTVKGRKLNQLLYTCI